MTFVKNTWHVAALSEEIEEGLLGHIVPLSVGVLKDGAV